MKVARTIPALFAVMAIGLLSPPLRAQDSRALFVLAEGTLLPSSRVLAVIVDETVVEPPTAAVALRAGSIPPAVGRGLDIAAVDGQIVFRGEVVAIERFQQAAAAAPVIIVRARDRLHRLNNGKHTREFTDVSDADIARQLASSGGLQARVEGPEASTRHGVVLQHQQTDLAFLRERAAAIGYVVFTDGTTLHFEKPRLVPQILVGCRPDDIRLRALLAWLASPDEVQQVVVRGWDPVKKLEILAKARQDAIGLSRSASTVEPAASVTDLGFVEALQTAGAAHAAAAGVLSTSTADAVSVEMAVDGDAALRARTEIVLHGAGEPFNGKYFVNGVSHRYHGSTGGGWQTLLRTIRDDRSVYLLPEVGDEVLVAFEQGDLNRPVIVGSLWNSPAPPDSSPCVRRAAVVTPGER